MTTTEGKSPEHCSSFTSRHSQSWKVESPQTSTQITDSENERQTLHGELGCFSLRFVIHGCLRYSLLSRWHNVAFTCHIHGMPIWLYTAFSDPPEAPVSLWWLCLETIRPNVNTQLLVSSVFLPWGWHDSIMNASPVPTFLRRMFRKKSNDYEGSSTSEASSAETTQKKMEGTVGIP